MLGYWDKMDLVCLRVNNFHMPLGEDFKVFYGDLMRRMGALKSRVYYDDIVRLMKIIDEVLYSGSYEVPEVCRSDLVQMRKNLEVSLGLFSYGAWGGGGVTKGIGG